jgi:hypothetical protein
MGEIQESDESDNILPALSAIVESVTKVEALRIQSEERMVLAAFEAEKDQNKILAELENKRGEREHERDRWARDFAVAGILLEVAIITGGVVLHALEMPQVGNLLLGLAAGAGAGAGATAYHHAERERREKQRGLPKLEPLDPSALERGRG